MPLTWNPDTDLFVKYDSKDNGKQEFEVTGNVALDNILVFDDAVSSATINVTIKAVSLTTPTTTSAFIITIIDVGNIVFNTGVKHVCK